MVAGHRRPATRWHGWKWFEMSGGKAGREGTGRVDGPGVAAGGPVAGAVWAALMGAGCPATVRELAASAGLRRDSVGRALRAFERGGRVCRERGDTRCGVPDRWSAVSTAESVLEVAVSGEVCDATSRHSLGARAKMTAASVSRAGAEGRFAGSGTARGASVDPPRRLARGELQAMVLQILRDCVPEQLSVVALARRAGGRSQGAVAGACERLVDQGQVVMIYGNARQYAAVENP